MAKEISNGIHTVKLYDYTDRGRRMHQLAYYEAGKRRLRNFSDKSEAETIARQVLGQLTNGTDAAHMLRLPELESLVAARKVLAPGYALHVAVEEHAQAVGRLGKATLREAVDFFLRHNRSDVPRLTIAEVAEKFAASREQAGLTAHYVAQCRKTIRDLAKGFPGRTLPDLQTGELDAWLCGLPFNAKTKNGTRTILVACGNWAEGRGYLVKDGNPFAAMMRYKETKAPVAIFSPENIAQLLKAADATLRPFLAIGAFAGLRTAELQRLDWREIDLERGFITVDANNLDNTTSQIAYTNASVSTPTITYSYDSYYPRITQMMVGTAATNYTYYPVGSLGAGLVHTDTSPIPNSGITYTYDQLGRLTTTSINGSTITQSFDSLNRLLTEADSALSSSSFVYNYVGNTPRLTSISYPNGQSTSYSYQQGPNQDFRLTDFTNYKTGTTVLSKFDYSYNENGTIASWQQQTDSSAPTTWNYQYDKADELLSAIKTNSAQAVLSQYVYAYDLAGNRTSEQNGLSVKSTSYNDNLLTGVNEITGISAGGPLQFSGQLSKPATVTVGGNAASVSSSNFFSGTANVTAGQSNLVSIVANDYEGNSVTNKYSVVVPANTSASPLYDFNGNLTNNGAGQSYTWDAKDELISITQGGNTYQFGYDGLRRRVSETDNGTLTKQWVWVGNRMAEERNASGAVTKRFFGLGEQISGTSYYLTRDHLGSVRELTNSSGAVQARYDYDPYGRASAVGTITVPSDFQYAGMYQHANSLLNFTKYRAYDPNTGRWLSRDPIAEQGGVNLYTYVNNNPIISLDPLGLDVWVYNSGGAHAYIVFTNPSSPTGYTSAGYYAPGANWNNNSSGAFYSPGKNDVTNTTPPTGGIQIKTTPTQDAAILAKAQAFEKQPGDYMVWGNNCANVARQELQAGIPTFPSTLIYDSPDSLANDAKKLGTHTSGSSPSGTGSSSSGSGSSSGSNSSTASNPNPGPD